jgi:hypothetical protein
MRQLAVRNEAMVAGKDLPTSFLLALPIIWPWRFLRQTVLLRPNGLPHLGVRLRRAPLIARAELEGMRCGLAKRNDVWRLRAISQGQIVRWLLRGVGPA